MQPQRVSPATFFWVAPALLFLGAVVGPASLAGVTSLLLDSAPGEPIGGGEFYFYTATDGNLVVAPYRAATPDDVILDFFGEGFWSLEFAAPEGESLAVGTYENAVSVSPRAPGQPGLDVYGLHRACVNTSGRFEVKQVDFNADGTLGAFWVTFEQTCEGAVLRGEVRLNADVPLVLDAPSRRTAFEGHELSFAVAGHDRQGKAVALSETGMPPGAAFTDAGDGTGRFSWTPEPGQAGSYWTALHGESTGGDSDAVYTRTDVYPDYDDFDHPIAFSTLPFDSRISNPVASPAADDPVCPGAGVGTGTATVWYAFTPEADARILAYSPPTVGGTIGGGPGIAVSIYSGERGALQQLACGFTAARADVVAGRTYHIMLGAPTGTLTLGLQVDALPPPPANDAFDTATVVGGLPFGDTLDMYGAVAETGDPAPCGYGPQQPNVWYVYTPAQDMRLTIDTTGSSGPAWVSVYSGPRDGLVLEGCGGPRLGVTAHAGRTYHLMISSGVIFSSFGSTLHLSITGAPALGIGVSVAPDALFDPHSGAAAIHGSVTCSRPARIVVSGTLEQGRGRTQGSFEVTVACSGATSWSAEVAAGTDPGRRGRFAGGAAVAAFDAVGVPDDNPDDAATASGRTTVNLRGTPPHGPGAIPAAAHKTGSDPKPAPVR